MSRRDIISIFSSSKKHKKQKKPEKALPASAKDVREVESIPGLGRSPGGGNDNPLQYSCLKNPINRMAQTIKNLPAMLETHVRSLGQKDCLDKGMATHSSILAWRFHG